VEKKAAVVTERIALHKTQKCVSASLDQSFLAAKIIPRATLEIIAFWPGITVTWTGAADNRTFRGEACGFSGFCRHIKYFFS